jgi:diguanylate cyclase (GGDEF)-like protein
MKTPGGAAATPDNLGFNILQALNLAVLVQCEPGRYAICGQPPEFYTRLFPPRSDGSPCASPWEFSPMLEFFLSEAESFFLTAQNGEAHSSGYWLETMDDNQDMPLLATARVIQGAKVILVQAAQDAYAERARILRKARSEILERRKIASDLTETKRKAQFDSLTNIYNRGALSELMEGQLTSIRAFTPKLALLMLDIDHFKRINDDFGHLSGDAVLVQLGNILQSSLRKKDSPIRYGGEEFIILAPNTTFEQSILAAEKLRKKVARHDFGLGRSITVSIGCTIYRPGESSSEVIARADQALYEAKNSGRNRVCGKNPFEGSSLPG